MRWLLSVCSAVVLGLVLLVVACNTVPANECWINTSGGFGATGTIPIGAGVGGGSSSDRHADPPPNPCVTQGSDNSQPTSPAPPAVGTGTPPCNQVLIGPPVTPGMGASGAGGSGAGGAGASAPDGGDTGDPNPAGAVSQTCVDGSELGTYIRCRGL